MAHVFNKGILRQLAATGLLLGCLFSVTVLAAGTLETVRVHGPSLEGNLEGDDSTRDVFVYLPPGYAGNPGKRYPVVYFLHGYGATAQLYVDFLGLPGAADGVIEAGASEMIIVIPDAYSAYSGSMYSNSPTTGDWEGYVADDLVSYIDANYRTIATPESRGLSGHSMGGYGTIRIGMKQPGVFSSLYSMSACCLMNQAPGQQGVEQQQARMAEGDISADAGFANTMQAQAAAWAPNPANPPYYFDWPFVDGEARPLVQAKWLANSPVVMVDQYVPALDSYRAIAIDVGDMDGLGAANMQLVEALNRLGVEHEFEEYEGDHMNRVASRFTDKLMGFFSEHLVAE